MSARPQNRFPLLALVVGGIGTLGACLGILAYSAPAVAIRIWPLLESKTVATALIASGAVCIALELILFVQWIRRLRRSADTANDAPVMRTRDRA